jgi:hypothetical protein
MIRANIVLAICLLVSIAAADELSWIEPTEDINGNYIDPVDIVIQLYWGYTNSDWNKSIIMKGSPADLAAVPPGCYYFALTAVRTDTEPYMESEFSEIVYYCTPGDLPPSAPADVGIN